ncbi:hypothetical protein [Methylobacterium radiotolerans]|uniref:hypothetical protein n=1 Tax=Methylobacterium radiotolerans TaxID=31998 RepID=UPI0015C68680|nr:hypothetical protein [Methylobacterium radiotolerans]
MSTATTAIYTGLITLALHAALPISEGHLAAGRIAPTGAKVARRISQPDGVAKSLIRTTSPASSPSSCVEETLSKRARARPATPR